jgi:hypothetical protein
MREKRAYGSHRALGELSLERKVEGSAPHPSLKDQSERRAAYSVSSFRCSRMVRFFRISSVRFFRCDSTTTITYGRNIDSVQYRTVRYSNGNTCNSTRKQCALRATCSHKTKQIDKKGNEKNSRIYNTFVSDVIIPNLAN